MEKSEENWYKIQQLEEIDTPALVVYPERVKANIQTALDMVKDPGRLRPHVKTHKTIEVTRLLLEAGVNQFKCATIAEAEMLAIAGAKDILLAYQPVGPKIRRLFNLISNYPKVTFSCLVDHPDPTSKIAEMAVSENRVLQVYLDINLGTNRTGIPPGKEAVKLFEWASQLKGLSVQGFHIYDGHLRQKDLTQRKEACDLAYSEVENMVESLLSQGYPKPVVIAGGSTTFPIHLQRENVICSPGTFVYWDKGYAEVLTEQLFEPAALVITRVISLPSKNLICVDLGHKSIASENPIGNRIRFLNANDLEPVSQSEEHLVLQIKGPHSFKIGDVLYGVPFHICPTVALYDRVQTVIEGMPAGEWKVIGRERRLNF
jgi:D-serine deaminase-like pyridoxal phosphate-dependent protein